nr:TPA_asm: hypothetical protein HUJ06_027980 [Nelumbo nucifera]
MPIETFKPFSSWARPAFVFNTRPPSRHPCEAPHVFFFQSVVPASATEFLTTYTRRSPRWLPPCSSNGNHSADRISEVRVFSSAKRLDWIGTRRECCDFVGNSGMNVSEVRIRTCMENEGLT